MHSHLRRITSCVLVAAAIACSAGCSSATSSTPPNDGATGSNADAGTSATRTPTFHFVTSANGVDAEVSRIYFADRFVTKLEGLAPSSEVTVRAHFYAPQVKGKGYTSSATFVADSAGSIDTATMAPIRGTYTDADPEGLLWSMLPEPLAEGLGDDRTAAFFDASVDGNVVASAALARTFTAEDVVVTEVTTDGLVGVYYAPKGATNKVPVVAFGGSEGGLYGGEYQAARLSALGHPTLGVAYFGAKGVPSELADVPLEYFAKAFAWLDKRAETAKGKVVVIGGSRGGELALQLGSTFPSVVGVIAQMPSTYRWAGLSSPPGPAWTYHDAPLDYVASLGEQPPTVKGPDGKPAWVLRQNFVDALAAAKPEELERARIRIEDTQGPILMLGGSDDGMWPSCDFMKAGTDKLHASGHDAKYADEAHCFPGAGHNVLSVGLPTGETMWAKLQGGTYSLGGSARANARAGRQSDDAIKAFLARVAP